jgi:hypothetical protein
MTDLSPAAQAILRAAYEATRNPDWQTNFYTSYAAAALRAAVAHTQQHHGHDVWECDADELLAIAAELEGE